MTAYETRVLELLEKLVAEMRAMRREREHQKRHHSTLSRADLKRLEQLLPAIVAAKGSDFFAASELLEDGTAPLTRACEGLSAKQLGRLLCRAEGRRVGAYLLTYESSEAGINLWRVHRAISEAPVLQKGFPASTTRPTAGEWP